MGAQMNPDLGARLDIIAYDSQPYIREDAHHQTHKALYHIISVWLRQEKLPVSCWSCHLQMCLQSVNSTLCSHHQLWTGKFYENFSDLYYHTHMFTAHLRTVLKIGMALCTLHLLLSNFQQGSWYFKHYPFVRGNRIL